MEKVKPKQLARRIRGNDNKRALPPGSSSLPETIAQREPDLPLSSDQNLAKWVDPLAPSALSRILRKHDLPDFVGVSRTAIEEMIEAGEFPQPIRINDHGRILGWLEIEIIRWQQVRRALRDAGKAPLPKYRPMPPRPELMSPDERAAARNNRQAKRGDRRRRRSANVAPAASGRFTT